MPTTMKMKYEFACRIIKTGDGEYELEKIPDYVKRKLNIVLRDGNSKLVRVMVF